MCLYSVIGRWVTLLALQEATGACSPSLAGKVMDRSADQATALLEEVELAYVDEDGDLRLDQGAY